MWNLCAAASKDGSSCSSKTGVCVVAVQQSRTVCSFKHDILSNFLFLHFNLTSHQINTKIPLRSRRPVVNAIGPLGRARSRPNQGKVDEARRNLKRRLDDELNSYQTCTCIILVLVHI